ncbi:MAG: serpin family protein [Ruminococcus sp.]|nr:serpin family protein [Ruminococcus sp.]
MFKKVISAVLAITMVMGMCSCTDTASSQSPSSNHSSSQSEVGPSVLDKSIIQPTANYQFSPESLEQYDEKFISGVNGFSAQLFKNTVKQDLSQGKNTLVSPESVLFALGMTANGANGETLEQMRNVLCKNVDMQTFNKNMNKLIAEASSSADFKFSIANSVWVKNKDGITLSDQFSKTCKESYNAELFFAPFDDNTAKSMNSWVNEKTDKMIPDIIGKLDADTMAVLLNCIAFDAKWQKEYKTEDVNENAKFTNSKGEEVTCSMMHSTENNYISDKDSTGFIKPYLGGKYAFMAILPNEDIRLSDYVKSLTAEKFTALYNSASGSSKVIASMPKFTCDYNAKLNEPLINMGMSNAFDSAKADFKGITNDTELFIGSVLHKTHIQLDEQGTKAAAATAVTLDVKGAISSEEFRYVTLDRPYAYAIMDTETGIPVFMGTVCDPTAN